MEGAGAGAGDGGGREEIGGGSGGWRLEAKVEEEVEGAGGWRLVPDHSLAPYSAYRLAG